MTHVVYILKCADGSYYSGCTGNLAKRKSYHDSGKVKSTKYRLPVKMITKISFQEKYKAYFFEKYLKTGSGRAFMLKRLV